MNLISNLTCQHVHLSVDDIQYFIIIKNSCSGNAIFLYVYILYLCFDCVNCSVIVSCVDSGLLQIWKDHESPVSV